MAVRSTPAHVFRENNILETPKQLVQVPVSLRRLVATVTGVKTPNPRFRRMCNLLGTTKPVLKSELQIWTHRCSEKF